MKDFDAFFKEVEKEPIKFKLFEQEESIPASLPAIVILKLNQAWQKYGDEALPEAENLNLAISLFGNDKIEEWCSKGLTGNQLIGLLEWAMAQYNLGKKKGAGSKKKKQTSTSLKTGF